MARTPANRKDKASDESATNADNRNNKRSDESTNDIIGFATRLSKIESYKQFFRNPAVGEKSQCFHDYPIEYWSQPNKTMNDVIEHAQSFATTHIYEVRKKYESWAAKHNATLDGTIPYNDEDNVAVTEYGSDSEPDNVTVTEYGSDSEPEEKSYPNQAPPENVLKKFVIALARFEPLYRWLLMTDYMDDISTDSFNKIEYHRTCICPMNNSCIDWLKKSVPKISKHSMPKCDKKNKTCSAYPILPSYIHAHCCHFQQYCCYHHLTGIFLLTICQSLKIKRNNTKSFRFSDEICHKKVPTVTIPNETEASIEDNTPIPRKREQGGRRGNGHRGRHNQWGYYGNRNRQGNPNWYAPNERYASRNPNVNRNNDRNWNEFRRYQHNTFHGRDRYNMNTRHKHFYDSHLTDGSRNEGRGHINRFKNPPDVKVVDPYEKTSMSIQSSESSKKREIDEEDVDVSGITDPSKATGLGHLIPLLTDFSKNSQGNSLKFSADDLHIEISATKSNNNLSLHKK